MKGAFIFGAVCIVIVMVLICIYMEEKDKIMDEKIAMEQESALNKNTEAVAHIDPVYAEIDKLDRLSLNGHSAAHLSSKLENLAAEMSKKAK